MDVGPPTHPRPLISPEQCGTQALGAVVVALHNGPNDTVLLQQDFQYSNDRGGRPFPHFAKPFSPKSIQQSHSLN